MGVYITLESVYIFSVNAQVAQFLDALHQFPLEICISYLLNINFIYSRMRDSKLPTYTLELYSYTSTIYFPLFR